MPQPNKGPRFGGNPAHHNIILANLATELFRHGRIRTTLAKAKSVQPLAERMVTFAKRGDLHSRRQVLQVLRDKDVVHKLFADIGPAFAERDGGYTRVLKLGPRKGDAAPMALIELVEGVSVQGEGDLEEAPRRRWSLRRRSGTVSTTARDRAEDRAAAVDRGEDLDEPAYVDEESDADEGPEAVEDEGAETDTTGDDADGPQVSAADVEARLAAQDEAEEAEDSADDAETDTASETAAADDDAAEATADEDDEKK